jgi:hypothetical protein
MFILLAGVENDRLAFKLRADLSPINVIHNLKSEKNYPRQHKNNKKHFFSKGFEEWVEWVVVSSSAINNGEDKLTSDNEIQFYNFTLSSNPHHHI